MEKQRRMIQRRLEKIEKRERKLAMQRPANRPEAQGSLSQKIEREIPAGLRSKLELAFCKAFQLVFEKGVLVIEKTYDKKKLSVEHAVYDYALHNRGAKKDLRAVGRRSVRSSRAVAGMTALEGVGLGLFGIGLPDIPIFTGALLKGIYEIALSFGFCYDTVEERCYILRLIQASLAEGPERLRLGHQLDGPIRGTEEELGQELRRAAQALSAGMLVVKFIQGLPVVGVVGGAYNLVYSNKILGYARLKYEKRYLLSKLAQKA